MPEEKEQEEGKIEKKGKMPVREVLNKKNNLEAADEINLHELQIKLEKIKGYIRKTETRVGGNEQMLARLREKRMEVENKRLEASVIKKHKLEKSV